MVIGAAYLLGVQGITISVHLPLNNQLQSFRVNEVDSESIHEQRRRFEARWQYFNKIRTVISCVVTMSLMVVLGVI